jgi:hypothetical protein
MDENLTIKRHTIHVLMAIVRNHTDFLKTNFNLTLILDMLQQLISQEQTDSSEL